MSDSKFTDEQKANCWYFLGSKDQRGYGRIDGGRAHRVAYESVVGPIGDKFVLHRCDNPPCINPDHLFLGTPMDNVKDMIMKGRARYKASYGEGHGRHKLTLREVKTIIKEHRSRKQSTIKAFCARYNVASGTIQKIIYGQNWVHALASKGEK